MELPEKAMDMGIEDKNEVLEEKGIGESAISNWGGGGDIVITSDAEMQDLTVNKERRNTDAEDEIEAPNL